MRVPQQMPAMNPMAQDQQKPIILVAPLNVMN